MTGAELSQLATAVGVSLTALGQIYNAYISRQNGKKADTIVQKTDVIDKKADVIAVKAEEVHNVVNNKMDQLITGSHAQGVLDEKVAQQQAETNRLAEIGRSVESSIESGINGKLVEKEIKP